MRGLPRHRRLGAAGYEAIASMRMRAAEGAPGRRDIFTNDGTRYRAGHDEGARSSPRRRACGAAARAGHFS